MRVHVVLPWLKSSECDYLAICSLAYTVCESSDHIMSHFIFMWIHQFLSVQELRAMAALNSAFFSVVWVILE